MSNAASSTFSIDVHNRYSLFYFDWLYSIIIDHRISFILEKVKCIVDKADSDAVYVSGFLNCLFNDCSFSFFTQAKAVACLHCFLEICNSLK